MEYQDYYQTLGVSKTATEAEIKRAYRDLAKKYHPDHNQGDKNAEEKFKAINEAYEVLKDKEKRARYDQLGSSYKQWEQNGGSSAIPCAMPTVNGFKKALEKPILEATYTMSSPMMAS